MAELNDGLDYSQDFKLISCKILFSNGNAYEMKPMVVELNYFEDLFFQGITGNFVLVDTNNFISKFAMTGNEYVYISFDKPGNDKPIEKVFRIFKVSDRVLVKEQTEQYAVHFCSEEILLSEQHKVSKSYPGKNIVEIVKDILTTTLKVNPRKIIESNFEKTSGTYNFIVPNLKPFEAISWLSTYAIPDEKLTQGASFLFYENRDGYNFRSLLSLYKSKPVLTYHYSAKNINSTDDNRVKDMDQEVVNVLKYEFVKCFDMLDNTMNGMFSNRLISIDPLQRNFNVTDFDYDTYINDTTKTTKLNSYGLLNNAQNRLGEQNNKVPQSLLKVVTTNAGQSLNKYIADRVGMTKEINIETFVPYRTTQLAQIDSTKLRLVVPGNMTIKVGDVITFNLPSTELVDTDGRKLDPYYSGNYLITALRHKMDQENRFETILELSKESSATIYPNFSNDLPIWKTVREE